MSNESKQKPKRKDVSGYIAKGTATRKRVLAKTPQQKKKEEAEFIASILSGKSPKQAAEALGYKPGGSSEQAGATMFKNLQPIIDRLMKEAATKAEEECRSSAEWVIKRLEIEAERTRDNDGTAGARVTALKALGAHHGLTLDRAKIETRNEKVLLVIEE